MSQKFFGIILKYSKADLLSLKQNKTSVLMYSFPKKVLKIVGENLALYVLFHSHTAVNKVHSFCLRN